MKKRLHSLIALILAALLCVCASACAAASGGALSEAVAESESTSVWSSADSASSNSYATAPMMAEEAPMAAPAEPAPDPAQTDDADYEKKIVYTGYLTIRAENPAKALETAAAAAEALGGYVSSSYTSASEDGGYGHATLKVPAATLSALMDNIAGLGEQTERRLESEDVSLSYYDIDARLTAAKAEERQLLSILDACETVEDVLAVRAQLSSVREDIESYQARINLWDHQVAYATLELSVQPVEKTAVAGEGSIITLWGASDVLSRIGVGFQNGWRFLLNALSAIGIGLAYAIIPLAVLGAIAFGIVKLVRCIGKRRAAKKEARTGDKLKN